MDFCRNISVSGGLPSEYQPEQLLSSSKLGSSLDDLFSSHNMEGDVSLEWLSIFVEDCFSSGGNCLPPAPKNELQRTTTTTTTTKIASEASKKKPLDLEEKIQQKTTTSSCLHKFVIPGKARSKRKRGPAVAKSKTQLVTSWSNHENNLHLGCSSDPPLLQQAYWLADSELILPKKEDTNSSRSRETERAVGKEEEEMVAVGVKEKILRGSSSMEEEMGNIIIGGQVQVQGQQGRRCSHCLSQRTPQWRAGPMGPKTLCNACGVRYKSGRLLPEYRPAKSPTFVSYKHSNSHKKVLEMREMSLLSSIPIPSTHQHS